MVPEDFETMMVEQKQQESCLEQQLRAHIWNSKQEAVSIWGTGGGFRHCKAYPSHTHPPTTSCHSYQTVLPTGGHTFRDMILWRVVLTQTATSSFSCLMFQLLV